MEGVTGVSDPVVRIENLQLNRGPRTVLAGAAFTAARGEVVARMGASGSGKTSILRAISGLVGFDGGIISVDGVRMAPGTANASVLRELRRKVGMVFQFHCLFEHMSALQNVWLAPVHVQRVEQGEAERRGMDLLKSLGVEHRARALPRQLSGGEAQRVAIARALATDPPVLLMDEPTASLDPARRMELASLVRSLGSRRRTLIVATHDESFAEAVASRVLARQEGRVTARV
jgi:ABC-type polar amino acid transport system ATPase subunit